MFNYTVRDRLGNVIGGERAENMTLEISGESFVSLLQFDDGGHCQICEEGLWLSSISVDSDFTEYTLQISMDSNNLVLGQSDIVLDITGCPAGYGVASDEVLCSICDVGTYNLDDDVLRKCNSCDSDKNPNVHCSDGSIFIAEGIWMGFDNDSIISAVCPSSFCCHPDGDEYCDYIADDDSRCTDNRDSQSFLCGKCNDGFSESMTSANCI